VKLKETFEDLSFVMTPARDRVRDAEPVSLSVLVVVVIEGLSFLWDHRNVTAAYVRWRLGTLYGSFTPSGGDRPMRELLRDLWRDRRSVVDYLLWRRGMKVTREIS